MSGIFLLYLRQKTSVFLLLIELKHNTNLEFYYFILACPKINYNFLKIQKTTFCYVALTTLLQNVLLFLVVMAKLISGDKN